MSINMYQELLSQEQSPEVRTSFEKQLGFVAFSHHVYELGRSQHITPDLAGGITTISIPAYFALDRNTVNPVNKAALELLPTFSFHLAYGDSVDVRRHDSAFQSACRIPTSALRSARLGLAVQHTIATALRLSDTGDQLFVHDQSKFRNAGQLLARDLVRDFNEGIVGEVSDVAQMVRDKGYEDFLDYLIDVREVSKERAATIFAHEAPDLTT